MMIVRYFELPSQVSIGQSRTKASHIDADGEGAESHLIAAQRRPPVFAGGLGAEGVTRVRDRYEIAAPIAAISMW